MRDLNYPDQLEELISVLKTLPGVGRRGAERIALAILKWPSEKQCAAGNLISSLPEKIGSCPDCGAVTGVGEKCFVCSASNRDHSLLCVVEEPQQVFTIEKSGFFRGLYHVLGGRLSPLDMENGENLSTGKLLERVNEGTFKEVILALSSDVEGRATAVYLTELLKSSGVKISRPAQGLPAGANLAYADAATIQAALLGRQEM